MLTISKNNIDYIFICILLLFSTSANIHLSGIPGCFLLFICALSYQFIQERKILISHKFLLLIGLQLIYFGLLSILHHQLEYYKFICYFTYSYAAYVAIRIVSNKLLFYTEAAITMFAYISVFFFYGNLSIRQVCFISSSRSVYNTQMPLPHPKTGLPTTCLYTRSTPRSTDHLPETAGYSSNRG